MSVKQPTKAIIAAAGFGTRFLPQTKAMPKEMLPLIDKPIIQYVVEELVEAGITDIIIVGSANKRAIEDHFDLPNQELLDNLRAGGEKKKPFIETVKRVSELANFIYVRQKGPYGNATPLLCASHLIGDDEPFIYKFADDFFSPEANSVRQMIEVYQRHQGGVFACKKARTDDEYGSYGFAAGETINPTLIKMEKIIEKPGSKEAAPSDLASVSGYLLPAKLLDYIEKGANVHTQGEFTFQPFVQQMIDDDHDFYAYEIQNAEFYDTGSPIEHLKTTIDLALKHPAYGTQLEAYLKQRL